MDHGMRPGDEITRKAAPGSATALTPAWADAGAGTTPVQRAVGLSAVFGVHALLGWTLVSDRLTSSDDH